jgi:predicted ATPase
VFSGDWSLEAAEHVGADGTLTRSAVFETLSSLVIKSLVVANVESGAARYRMLETVRQYAREALVKSGELDVVSQQYAAFYLALAEDADPLLLGPEQTSVLERLDREHDNLLGALRWQLEAGALHDALRLVGALGWFWILRGYRSEGLRWLELVLGRTQSAASELG